MNSLYIFMMITSLLLGAMMYFASGDIYVGLVVVAFTILFFLLVLLKRHKKTKIVLNKFHECYHFINNFIIVINIKESLLSALEMSVAASSDELKNEMKNIDDLKEVEKLIYLKRYFKFNLYNVFLDIILIWAEQGGDILSMTSMLVNQARESEEYISFSESQNKRKLVEFISLWLIAIVVVIILRFSLADFYEEIYAQITFKGCLVAFYMLILFSINIFSRKMCKYELRGWDEDEEGIV